MKTSKDYNDGFRSGLLHDDNNPLCVDNLRKAKLPHDSVRVIDYWRGYLMGVDSRNEGTI